ncbi:MAG: hypothetical protein KDC53_11475, partial [Saprospiraceae bacterium]|nr:hypothetical protein [Saprospiraceae bacterium]
MDHVYLFAIGLFFWMTIGSWDNNDSSQEDPVVAQIDADWNYVDDQLCAICHQKIFDSYQEIGMAQSFRNPNNI